MKYSPVPLVYHNKWNDLDAADRLDLGYVMGFVMVFGKFFLRGDRVAGRCLEGGSANWFAIWLRPSVIGTGANSARQC